MMSTITICISSSFGFIIVFSSYSNSPVKMGDILQIVIGPKEANCPNANSRKNNGSPQTIRTIMYGTRNAPVGQPIKCFMFLCMYISLILH